MKEARVVKIANTTPPVFIRAVITTIARNSSSCRFDSFPIAADDPCKVGDYDDDGIPDLMVTFDLCTTVPGKLDREAILSLFRTVKLGRTYLDVRVTVNGER